jgi:hypothetical protein
MDNTAEKLASPNPLKSVLRSAQKPATETKSKTPVIDADTEIKNLTAEIAKLKREIDDRDTQLQRLSADLLSAVAPMRASLCRREYVSAIRVRNNDTNTSLLVVWSSNYTKIPPGKEAELIEIVGQKYPEYFKSKFVISAEDKSDSELYQLFEWLAPDDTDAGLQEGQRRFAEFFAVDEVIKPTERFIHDHVLMSEETRERLELAGVKQYKPSIRTR